MKSEKPDPAPSFDDWISQGMAASQGDDSAQAIDCFQQAAAAKPDAALPQFLLGAEFAALGDIAQAETAYANATRLAPGLAMARYQLGLLQFSTGRAAVALLTWQDLLQLPDSDPLPHLVRGFGTLAEDSFSAALFHFEQGLARATANPALAADVEKLMARVRPLVADAAAPGDAALSEAEARALLANYRQQGRAH